MQIPIFPFNANNTEAHEVSNGFGNTQWNTLYWSWVNDTNGVCMCMCVCIGFAPKIVKSGRHSSFDWIYLITFQRNDFTLNKYKRLDKFPLNCLLVLICFFFLMRYQKQRHAAHAYRHTEYIPPCAHRYSALLTHVMNLCTFETSE